MSTEHQEIEELQDVTLVEESEERLELKATEDATEIASQESNRSEVTQIDSAKESIEKLKQFTEEDENKNSSSSSLRSILGGDFLTAKMVRGQLGLIILIAIFFIFYINNRYKNQAELIEIDNLKKELDDARFRALTRSSELTSKSRQSYIEDYLRSSKDSLLQISSSSPYVIKLNGESILPVHKDETLTLEELKNLPDSIIE
ncbi:MAG: hypothetical protein MJZ83_00270 [Bacteroidaceae bacterium]|nr:hypothetical protein [Bacteroidaceae bacterium]